MLDNAGFTVDEVAEIPLKNNTSAIKDYEKYYLTVATPKPVITEYDVPPEVYVRIPEKLLFSTTLKSKIFHKLKMMLILIKKILFIKSTIFFLLEKLKEVLNLFYRLAILRKALTVHCNLNGIFLI